MITSRNIEYVVKFLNFGGDLMNRIRSRLVGLLVLPLIAISLLGIASAAQADEPNCVRIGSGCATECGNDCNYVSYVEIYCIDCGCSNFYVGPCCSCA
jgi:hypothetical protein